MAPNDYKNTESFSNSPDGGFVLALAFALEKVKRVPPAGIAITENA